MAYERHSVGIVACPGSSFLSTLIIARIKNLSKKLVGQEFYNFAKLYSTGYDEFIKDSILISSFTMPHDKNNLLNDDSFLIKSRFIRFPNGEFKSELLESVRGRDIFVLQDVCNTNPVDFSNQKNVSLSINDHLINLLTTIDACARAGASRISVLVPFYPYSRQDRKISRESLSASLFSHILENMNVSTIITMDLHAPQIENAFRTTHLTNIYASLTLLNVLNTLIDVYSSDLVIVAPDTGSIKRNKFFAVHLKCPLAMIYKERNYSKITENAEHSNIDDLKLIGEVKGKTVFINDDMLDTGGTILTAFKLLKKAGATKIICGVTLPLFSGDGVQAFEKAYKEGLFDYIIGTNAVTQVPELLETSWYKEVDISFLLAQAIFSLHYHQDLTQAIAASQNSHSPSNNQ